MYEARIDLDSVCHGSVVVGPTDTRDEAARLARAWLESNPASLGRSRGSVVITRVAEEECPHCGRSDGKHDQGYSCAE